MAIFTARLDDREVQSGQKPTHACREYDPHEPLTVTPAADVTDSGVDLGLGRLGGHFRIHLPELVR
jgi:hypothetical protein